MRKRREYLAGGPATYFGSYGPLLERAVAVLPKSGDKILQEFGDDAYSLMETDPAVSAAVTILKGLILYHPLRLTSPITDEKDPNFTKAQEVLKFTEKALKGMSRPLAVVLQEALEAIVYGSSLNEVVYEAKTIDGVVRWVFTDIKTRARERYRLVVDRGFNLLGATDASIQSGEGTYPSDDILKNLTVVPRNRLWVLAFGSKNGDPRGNSLIRAAWNPHYLKAQVPPAYLKYLVAFGSPSLVGFTPEGDVQDITVRDEAGNEVFGEDGEPLTISPEEDMFNNLLGFQAGSAAVFKGGSKLQPLEAGGNGEAFVTCFELMDRQIAMAILANARTLLEAKHGAKADVEGAQDITDVVVALLRSVLEGTFTLDVIKPLVFDNFGAEAAELYCPEASLGGVQKQDFAKASQAVAALWTSKYLDESQVEKVDSMIGLPERDGEAWRARMQESRELAASIGGEREKLFNPKIGTEQGGNIEGDDQEEGVK